ncbi:MAG: SPOR domain-containing protein [Candidatus Omnitrophica bacterium]|nr:SPOR domain-containing protein [Candidatus Omnitrophota bacterium]
MAHGMSEEEVKKKLYGEFVGAGAAKEATPSISIKSSRKFIPIKAISIIAIAFLALLSIIIIGVNRPKSKIEPSKVSEAAIEINGYLLQGKKYYKDGLFDEAILTWKSIIAIAPDHRTALRYIRRAELKKKELKIREEETAQRLKEMLAKREQEEKEKIHRAEIQHILKEGDVHFRKGDYPLAVAQYEKVLLLSPGNRHAVKKIARAQKKIVPEKEKLQASQKQAAAASPPPVPVVKKGPLYTVQIVTYRDRTHAEELAKKLTADGHKKLIIQKVTAKSGRILYEVHLGPFDNKKDAEGEMKKIKKEGFNDSFIRIK